jgi:hypothetical protein
MQPPQCAVTLVPAGCHAVSHIVMATTLAAKRHNNRSSPTPLGGLAYCNGLHWAAPTSYLTPWPLITTARSTALLLG